jgi:hypothetical protein
MCRTIKLAVSQVWSTPTLKCVTYRCSPTPHKRIEQHPLPPLFIPRHFRNGGWIQPVWLRLPTAKGLTTAGRNNSNHDLTLKYPTCPTSPLPFFYGLPLSNVTTFIFKLFFLSVFWIRIKWIHNLMALLDPDPQKFWITDTDPVTDPDPYYFIKGSKKIELNKDHWYLHF